MGCHGWSPPAPGGCPPDIVESLRDQIGAALPADCRAWGPGIPVRVQPQGGVIWATGLGYGVRVPLDLIAAAIQAGREDHDHLARRRHDGSSKKPRRGLSVRR